MARRLVASILSVALARAASEALPPITCDPSDPGKCMCNGQPIGPSTYTPPPWFAPPNVTSLFDLSATLEGKEVPLSTYAAKATIVMNVASACGLGNLNYKGIDELLDKFGSHGLSILGFPSNQFGGQAPCDDECERAYMLHKLGLKEGEAPVHIFDKVDANGENASPVYRWLKRQPKASLDLCGGCDVAWNYEKFLVDSDGVPVRRIASASSPLELERDIRALLGLNGSKRSGLSRGARSPSARRLARTLPFPR